MDEQFPLILDGGLATELESRGHDLADRLWSARLLSDAPQEIGSVHRTWLRAGADCITTASYQASIPGFIESGIQEERAVELLQRSVFLAQAERDLFWNEMSKNRQRSRPLVAASVGPFGAYLANGAEYTGDYHVTKDQLRAFHGRRWRILASENPDVMLCETIPCLPELRVLAELAADTPEIPTWVSVCCRDEAHICDGTPLRQVVRYLNDQEAVDRIGVNCIPPRMVSGLINEIRISTNKPVIVYPNSGESWEPRQKVWKGDSSLAEFPELGKQWRDQGATVIGGCCRIGPRHIRGLRDALVDA